MTLNIARVRKYLKDFDFETLFIEELGWDRHSADLEVSINGQQYPLRGFAEKRGVQVFECRAEVTSKMPDFKTQRKIETQLRRAAREHLVIYTDATKTKQVWKPVDWRGHEFYPGHQSGDSLIEKLQAIQIPLDEEEALDLLGAVHKLRDAFDRDRITKRFYDYFQKEHKAFLGFIEGIREQGEQEWYASLMLNRLMFVYFIQKKGFLDRDTDYLRNRLKMVQSRKGKGKFHTFYRYFLLALFHQGFSTQPDQRELDPDLKGLLGDVPYLNGGLFDVHELEQNNPKIDIPDEAFDRIFGFFDQFEWTLDTRPLRNDKEINPDVLGYIFEKYINQKQMGAYYTKEDITDYISRNTVIPYLFDEARKKCAVAFQPGSALWRLLQESPDRYIYPAVRKGVIDDKGEIIPIPDEIKKGIEDVGERGGWNRPAEAEYALPTETWREYAARRERCLDVRQRLAQGSISQINDLITHNLDIRRFAEDAILSSEGPELLRAFYQAITGITVLDPTCGSGAFLFAALNILEPLYEACLDRMQTFLEDLQRLGNRASPEKFKDFRAVLEDVARHPNAAYFILKSIIVRNLYGVDIMEEAVEICKLRLFLKLVSQVDNVRQLEPLPDIDFNIRPGNTLVGFATVADVKRTILGKLADEELKAQVNRIAEEAEIVDRAFQRFHEMQTEHGMNACDFAAQKQELRIRLDRLSEQLDQYLAGEYGVDPDKTKEFQKWQLSHQPFHWCAEFFGIIRRGGFDVIIGNPPYLESSKLNGRYCVKGYATERCRDIYAWVVERVTALPNTLGRIGLIVPVSIVSSGSFDVVRSVLDKTKALLWFAHFANRPGQLFSGAQNRLTIFLRASSIESRVLSSKYHRWDGRNGERDALFHVLQYTELGELARKFHGLYPKVGCREAASVIQKSASHHTLSESLSHSSTLAVYWVRVPGYFCQFFLEQPMAKPEDGGPRRPRGEVNAIHVSDEQKQRILHALLNSSTYLQFYCAYTDGRHVNPSDVKDFPLDFATISQSTVTQLVRLSKRLERAMKENVSYWRKSGLLIESVDSRPTKPILDEIDRVLANHYGLTEAELDYIVNHDVKYRLGKGDEEDDE